jgi:hypothetical protein
MKHFLAILALALPLHAQTDTGPPNGRQPPPPAPLLIEHVVDVPYSHGGWNGSGYHEAVAVPQFDPLPGQRLRAVAVKWRSYVATDLVVENTSTMGGCQFYWQIEAHVTLTAPSGAVVADDDFLDTLRRWRIGSFDGVVDGFGASGRSETRIGIGSENVTQLAGIELLQFIGPGSAIFDLERSGHFHQSSTSVNVHIEHNRRMAGQLVVQYLVQ